MRMIDDLREFVRTSWASRRPVPFPVLFRNFKSILKANNEILELLADMGEKLEGESVFDRRYMADVCERVGDLVFKLISNLSILTQSENGELFKAFARIRENIQDILAERRVKPDSRLVALLDQLKADSDEEAGNKFANLGEIRNVLGLSTPDGFVISTAAFYDFMEHNDLFESVDRVVERCESGEEDGFESLCEEVRRGILGGSIPAGLASQISAMRDTISKRHKGRALRFAVRSSAWGEDGRSSFAGQYESVLNVPPTGIVEAYRQVIASAYTAEAWAYRLHRGYKEYETAMAVGCQVMVPARVSGVMYSSSPLAADREAVLITAAWGLGPTVAQGTGEADTFVVERKEPHRVLSQDIKRKTRMMPAEPGGGSGWSNVPDSLREIRCLTDEQVVELARTAMAIERHFRDPQDIEWAFDEEGVLHILQARPLNVKSQSSEGVSAPLDACPLDQVVFASKGSVVYRGIASGQVVILESDEEIREFPHGAILVVQRTNPRYARLMRKACGIITDHGSATGHMAALAREYRIPTVVDTGVATRWLKTGEEITLDAVRNVVYRGMVAGLEQAESVEQEVFQETYEYRLLKRLLRKINPLNLVDPLSDEFKPDRCRTCHDITRYIHEKAVERLIDLSERFQRYHDKRPKRLESNPPLGLTVIDIEDGTSASRDARSITPEQIVSLPLRAFLEGLSESGMWSTDPAPIDMGSLMSSVVRSFSSPSLETAHKVRNLVVISKEYMNLSIKLGYHFTMVDAYIGHASNDNYIYFRFAGGMADLIRRSRRGRFIAGVLKNLDFSVDTRGDVVVGRLKKVSKDKMYPKMKVLGGLIGYSRQLDVGMSCDEHINRCLTDFMERTRLFSKPFGGNTE